MEIPPFANEIPSGLKDLVGHARFLLNTVRNAALGTVGASPVDGSPASHVTVITSALESSPNADESALTYWSWSFPSARHSRNLPNTDGRVSITLQHSFSTQESLTLEGTMRRIEADGDPDGDFARQLARFNRLRGRFALPERPQAEFLRPRNPMELYRTEIDRVTMPVPREERGVLLDNRFTELDPDWLRGFENDSWRLRWLGMRARLLVGLSV